MPLLNVFSKNWKSAQYWRIIEKGVPQGSILGPSLFNFFVNDLLFPAAEYSIANYADDTTIVVSAANNDMLLRNLNAATHVAIKWFEENSMQANPAKFQFITFGCTTDNLRINENVSLENSDCVKLLGVQLDTKLKFKKQIAAICRKSAWQLCALKRISKYLSQEARMIIFKSFIASNLSYCNTVWHFCSKQCTAKLEKIQERGLRIVLDDYESQYEHLLHRSKMKSLLEVRLQCLMTEVFKARKGLSPMYISELFVKKSTPYNLYRKDLLQITNKRTVTYGLNSFAHVGAKVWNKLPNELKDTDSVNQFKSGLANIDILRLSNG